MINLPVGTLAAAASSIASFSQMITFAIQGNAGKVILWDGIGGIDGLEKVSEAAGEIENVAELLGMPVTLQYAKALTSIIEEIVRQDGGDVRIFDAVFAQNLNHLSTALGTALRKEAEACVAVVLPTDKLKFYEPDEPLFGLEVAALFPSALYDITEAGKCLALGRSTACVFHLMRVVEIALRSIHACLGLTASNNPNWGNWLKEIREERVKRGDRKWAENDYFQDVYSKIDAIKDAHRDPTMHVQTIHKEEEAALIFESTKALMKKIASRMDEKGMPRAQS